MTRYLSNAMYGRFAHMQCRRNFVTSYKLLNNVKFLNRQRSNIQAGQKLPETRPFLLKPGELTPGITAIEYHRRRLNLIKMIPSGSCVIIPGNDVKYASGAVFYPFQQDNDLYYLTGWNEPNSVLVLENLNNELKTTMFVPGKDAFAEQWEGFRSGIQGAIDIFNTDEAFTIDTLSQNLPNILNRNRTIYYNDKSINFSKISSVLHADTNAFHTFKNFKLLISSLRKVKSDAELRIMRRAGQISGKAYNQAFSKKFRNERTLASFLDYNFISGGCDKSAYIPVVASGSNSLCIHYTKNDDVMYDDELVLVDASGSLGGYCSDISRTWPTNGQFTDAQKDLYQAVLNVQRSCIELCKASNGLSLQDIHDESIKFMSEELRNLGIAEVKNWDVERLYPHYIGHNLGLDVHDVPECSRYLPLQKNQVITIEPGLYIPDDKQFPKYFRNVGIRIEDDIAIGEDTYTNLTVEAVKEIADLERIMHSGETLTKFQDDIVSPLES